MPVEVRKISVKANVVPERKGESQKILNTSENKEEILSYKEREAIIQDCIDIILQELEEQRKR